MRACLENGGKSCNLCKKGWYSYDCKVEQYKTWAHFIGKQEILQAVKTGQITYLKQAITLYAPWKLGELEKLLVLI